MITQELEWVNILKHSTSGDLYLSTDAENGAINRICGPVVGRHLSTGVDPHWEPDDVEWANEQQWTLLGTLADLAYVLDENGQSQPSPLALTIGAA